MAILNFQDFLFNIHTKPLRLLDASIINSNYVALDLSEDNNELQTIDVSSSSKLAMHINSHLHKHNPLVAFGGYVCRAVDFGQLTFSL